MGKKTWNKEQEEYLLNNYGKLQLDEIAIAINKTPDAVDAKLRRMKVPRIGLRERMKQLAKDGKHPMQRPEVIEKFLGENNPSCKPEVRQKISEIRKKEYEDGVNKCGWLGPQKFPTDSEKAIYAGMIKMGFVWNLHILTGQPVGGRLAANYHLDFGHEELKLCVEIDGNSHRGTKRKSRDQRKDDFLKSQGWIVVRYTNKQVLSNPANIIKEIKAKMAELNDHKSHI